jgi:multisubunit Na+/H+ antiporter MnhF subunit
MNAWLIAASVLFGALIACGGVCVFSDLVSGLVALEVAGVVAATLLMLLAEGLHRQPFIDLALVLAVLSLAGSLLFVRMLERRL